MNRFRIEYSSGVVEYTDLDAETVEQATALYLGHDDGSAKVELMGAIAQTVEEPAVAAGVPDAGVLEQKIAAIEAPNQARVDAPDREIGRAHV